MSFSSGQTKLIYGCPYQAGVRRAGFHCTVLAPVFVTVAIFVVVVVAAFATG